MVKISGTLEDIALGELVTGHNEGKRWNNEWSR